MPKIPAKLRAQIRQRDGDRCAYCHTPEALTVTPLELDHIIPLSVGGRTELENLCLACPACNRFKGSSEVAHDPITGEYVALFHPLTQQWEKHFQWQADQSEIHGLTPVGRATAIALHLNRPQMVRLRKLWGKIGR
jgi:hypothetical protein